MTNVPDDFDVDDDPETEEDGKGDNVDRPLPDPEKFEES